MSRQNNQLQIKCNNGNHFLCERSILSERSDYFRALLNNGMKENYQDHIKINIDINIMKLIYNKSFPFNTYNSNLFDWLKVLSETDWEEYFLLSKSLRIELYSRCIEFIHLFNSKEKVASINTYLLNLTKKISSIDINEIDFGVLSLTAIKYILRIKKFSGKQFEFINSEYEFFRYGIISLVKEEAFDLLQKIKQIIPTYNELDHCNNVKYIKELIDIIRTRPQLVDTFSKFDGLLDYNQIEESIICKILYPFYMHIFESFYTHTSEFLKINIRIFNNYFWDEKFCGSELIIEDNNKKVRNNCGMCDYQSVRSKKLLENDVYEWLIKKKGNGSFAVGVCGKEKFNTEEFAGNQVMGWVLASDGMCYHNSKYKIYCPPIEDEKDTEILVQIDIKRKECSFTINGIKYSKVYWWNNLTTQLYPVVSLFGICRKRITIELYKVIVTSD